MAPSEATQTLQNPCGNHMGLLGLCSGCRMFELLTVWCVIVAFDGDAPWLARFGAALALFTFYVAS